MGKATKRKIKSEDGEDGQSRSKRAKTTPADKPARKVDQGKRATRKGASAKSRKPGKPKCATADNVGIKEALDQEVATEEKTSSSEVPSPGASDNSQSTAITTPEKQKPAERKEEILLPRGIVRPHQSCYFNTFFQCAEKHFPAGYAQLKDSFPLEGADVVEVLSKSSGIRGSKRGSTAARSTKSKAALQAKDGKDICLGAWVGDFLEELTGSTGRKRKTVNPKSLLQVQAPRNSDYNGLTQQDPAEYMPWLMGELSREWEEGKGTECPVEETFQGSYTEDVGLASIIFLQCYLLTLNS